MIRMSLLILVLAGWAFAPDTQAPVDPPGVHIDGPATLEQQARVLEAVTSFEEAGLVLPPTLVRFHDDGGCSEHMGLFSVSETQTVISICSDLPFVVTHELAHVWVHENIDDDAKQAYIEARELPTWRSRDFDWNERGVEDAAFVMQQVLMFGEDRSVSDSWQERVAAFKLLIGEPV